MVDNEILSETLSNESETFSQQGTKLITVGWLVGCMCKNNSMWCI